MKAFIANSGSGFKIEAHIGAEQALYERKVHILGRAGVSGGSIVAGLAGTGMTAPQMWSLAKASKFSKFFQWSPLAIMQFAYCNGDALHNWLLANTHYQAFIDTIYPVWMVSSNLNEQKMAVFSKESNPTMKLGDAMRASASIPFAYDTFIYDNVAYGDGGMSNNDPGALLPVKGNIPRIIVNVMSGNTTYAASDIISSPFIRAEASLNLMLSELNHRAIQLAIAQAPHSTYVVHVDASFVSMLETNIPEATQQRLYENGYNAMNALLDKIFPATSNKG